MWSSFHYHTLIRAALKSTSSRTAVHAKMFLKAIEKVNLNEQACGFFGVFFIRFLLRLHALVSSIVVDHSYCKNKETINAAFRLGRHESGYFLKKKTRTNRNKNKRIKKWADSLVSGGPKADTMKICGFKNTRIHLEGASERDVSKSWVRGQGLSFSFFLFFFFLRRMLF